MNTNIIKKIFLINSIKKNFYFIFFLLFFSASSVFAEDFYIAASQQGDGLGISCATAKSYTFYNDNLNCGTGDGKISSGDTVYLCDDGGDFTSTLTTPYSCNNFNINVAEGESPVINVSTGHGLSFPNVGKSNIVINGLTFTGWEDGKAALYFVDAIGPIEIKNSKFIKTNAVLASYAINFYVANGTAGAVGNVDIYDNEFTLNSKVEGIRIGIFTNTAMNRVHDVNVHHNKFTSVDKALRFFMSPNAQSWVPPQGLRPYNIKFDDNEVYSTNAAAVGTAAGITEIGGTSSISRNIIMDCGSSEQEMVNCLQLHWVDGVDINDNVIDDVDTLTCDGTAIILDWTISDDAYISSNNNVLRNHISNANAACGGRCISVYKGRDNLVANNLCDGTSADGLKIGSDEGIGNIFYNNTVINVANCFTLSDGDNIGVPESIWENNLCAHATNRGFKVVNNSLAPTESHNLFYDVSANDIILNLLTDLIADPLLNILGKLSNFSPAIDSGTDVGLTTDYDGNPIYGLPDMGAYEYQPPYTMGTDEPDISADVRIYGDGKFRNTQTTGGTTANLAITPSSTIKTQWMDLDISTWETSGNYLRQWTESSTNITGDVYHTIGDLENNKYYTISVDSVLGENITGANCSSGACLSNSSGQITFTYTGTYSTHTFILQKDLTGPNSFNLSSPANNVNVSGTTKPPLSWNSTTDVSGIAKYQLYINDSLDKDNISSSNTSTEPTTGFVCGNNTWYVKAVDNNGNTTNSNINNLTIVCDTGVVSGTPTIYGGDEEETTNSTGEITTGTEETQNNTGQIDNTVSEVNNNETIQSQLKTQNYQLKTFLWLGLQNEQVKILQEALATNLTTGLITGTELYPEAIISGYYGNLTAKAVQRFQCKYNIICSGTPETTGYGIVGSKTKAKFNEVYSSVFVSNSGAVQKESVTTTTSSNPSDEQAELMKLIQDQINILIKMVEELVKELNKILSQ